MAPWLLGRRASRPHDQEGLVVVTIDRNVLSGSLNWWVHSIVVFSGFFGFLAPLCPSLSLLAVACISVLPCMSCLPLSLLSSISLSISVFSSLPAPSLSSLSCAFYLGWLTALLCRHGLLFWGRSGDRDDMSPPILNMSLIICIRPKVTEPTRWSAANRKEKRKRVPYKAIRRPYARNLCPGGAGQGAA